ncbi:GntR family transcriptional regulator [Brachybacterium sp. DNPG3]
MTPRAVAPPAADRVYAHVKNRILAGEIAGGSMITEGEIAEATGLSRTPVREAFLRLQAEQWLTLYPKRGALVRPVAAGEAHDVLDARRMVEAHAARTICALPSADRARVVDALAEILAAQDAAIAAEDLAAYSLQDARFHQGIVAGGGNALVTEFAVTLRERQERLIAHTVQRDLERAALYVEGHHRLLERLRAADADGYLLELDQHLALSRETLA